MLKPETATRAVEGLAALPYSEEKLQIGQLLQGAELPFSEDVNGEYAQVDERVWALRVGMVVVVFRVAADGWAPPTHASLRGVSVIQISSLADIMDLQNLKTARPTLEPDENDVSVGTYVVDLVRAPDTLGPEDLLRAVEPLLGVVESSFAAGAWSSDPAREHDLHATMGSLRHELFPPTDRPVDRVQIERLSLRLAKALLEIVEDQESSEATRAASYLTSLSDFSGTNNDAKFAIALADELGRALDPAAMVKPPDLEDDDLWADLVGLASTKPALLTALALGWKQPTELWAAVANATRSDLTSRVMVAAGAAVTLLAAPGPGVVGVLAGGIIGFVWKLLRSNFHSSETR